MYFHCKLIVRLQYYSSLNCYVSENWTGNFVSVYVWMTATTGQSNKSLLSASVYTVTFTEKCSTAEKCHLNLPMLGKMWLKLSIILKYMTLTHICFLSCTCLFFRIQKWDGFKKVFEFWESLQRLLSEKVTTGSTFEWNELQNLLTCVAYLTCSDNSICYYWKEC